jgi:hypothetical protein
MRERGVYQKYVVYHDFGFSFAIDPVKDASDRDNKLSSFK